MTNKAIDPIRIHAPDDEAMVRRRHEEIVKRLEELGRDTVLSLRGHGLPTQWDPIVNSWLAGDKLKPEEKAKPAAELKKPEREGEERPARDGDDQRRR